MMQVGTSSGIVSILGPQEPWFQIKKVMTWFVMIMASDIAVATLLLVRKSVETEVATHQISKQTKESLKD